MKRHENKHLREWLFHSRTGVRVKKSSGVGVRTGMGANNLLGVDSGVDIYCLKFSLKHITGCSSDFGTKV
jgi:hypothetical protein